MKTLPRLIAVTALSLLAAPALAQFVKGNEAVRTMPDGSTKVETPPLPKNRLPPPCPADRKGCAGGGWMMVETDQGLSECTEIYARPGTCRPSTYGTQRMSRFWIVKAQGKWLQCQYPDVKGRCVSTAALPVGAVQ